MCSWTNYAIKGLCAPLHAEARVSPLLKRNNVVETHQIQVRLEFLACLSINRGFASKYS